MKRRKPRWRLGKRPNTALIARAAQRKLAEQTDTKQPNTGRTP